MDMTKIPITTAALMNGVPIATFRLWLKQKGISFHTYENGMEYYSLETLQRAFSIARKVWGSSWTWENQKTTKSTKPFTSMEFFAGGGGLALGLEQAGFDNILCVDMNASATQALRHNRPLWSVQTSTINDIKQEWLDSVDLISGGFPCQPFTVAGKQGGLSDTRGTAFFDFASVIGKVKPKVVLAENVKGLINHDKGKTLATILNVFEGLGYTVYAKLLNSMFYQVPQSRERLIMVGIRNDLVGEGFVPFEFPSVCHTLYSVRDALKAGDLYETDVPDSFAFSYNERTEFILSHVPAGGNWKDLPEGLKQEYAGAAFLDTRGGRSRLGRRLSWNDPSPTLLTDSLGKKTCACHPSETRPLAIREYARIQSFPDSWQFYGSPTAQFTQIGNAVPVNMAAAIGRSIVRFLNTLT